jgi:hypothetical protein
VKWKRKSGLSALCKWLDISEADYKLARAQIDRSYIEPTPKVDPKTGKARELCYPAPDSMLCLIQRRIKERILARIELLDEIRGYRPGSHNINTAAPICAYEFMGKVDISKFHPSITERHVAWALSEHGLSPSWAREIARVVTYKGALPQGASTSNHIANIITDSMFRRDVEAFTARRHVKFINFGDDTAFFGSNARSVKDCVAHCKKALRKYGFEPNSKCRECEHRGGKRLFIGCATGREQPDLPRDRYRALHKELRELLQAERMRCASAPLTTATQLNSLKHKIVYVGRLNSTKARSLKNVFYRLCAARRTFRRAEEIAGLEQAIA